MQNFRTPTTAELENIRELSAVLKPVYAEGLTLDGHLIVDVYESYMNGINDNGRLEISGLYTQSGKPEVLRHLKS